MKTTDLVTRLRATDMEWVGCKMSVDGRSTNDLLILLREAAVEIERLREESADLETLIVAPVLLLFKHDQEGPEGSVSKALRSEFQLCVKTQTGETAYWQKGGSLPDGWRWWCDEL